MKKYIQLFALLVVLAGVYGLSTTPKAQANPPAFIQVSTAPATSTLAYIMPGFATTTLVLDSAPGGVVFGADSAFLNIQLTATTSQVAASSTLLFRVESSWDNVDWYPQSQNLILGGSLATTTQITGNFSEFRWIPATTTDSAGSGTNSRLHQGVNIFTPTRYTRVKFYNPPGIANGNYGLWAQIVAKKQTF